MIDQMRTSPTNPGADGVRIGAVTYLNSKPLIEGLADFASEASLILDYPSRLADGLARGQLDVALVPSIESVADPDYEIVSDACVAARGPVLSVKLYFRTAPARVRTLALDEGSRTSAALARLMLAERYGVHPQIEPLRLEQDTTATAADAVLLIGDRAIEPPAESFRHVWDLGEEWLAWTGLPFVFALWVTRRGSALGRAEAGLAAARDRGLRDIHDIARRESKLMRLPLETVDDYLRHRLHFTLGSAERSGLRLYLNLAAKLGLAPEGRQPRFRETSPAPRGNAAASTRRERAEPVAR
ncbi:MAG: menaquinone biosynthesis protein [Planctomyces sp.]|nr:menaquinone biosynthesis protein [Planctomyces sp.]